MSNNIQALNHEAEKRVSQAHDLLVLLQRSDMSDQKDSKGHAVVDHGTVFNALDGVAHLLDEARDLHGEIDCALSREVKS